MSWLLGLVLALGYLWYRSRSVSGPEAVLEKVQQRLEVLAVDVETLAVRGLTPEQLRLPEAIDVSLPAAVGSERAIEGPNAYCPGCGRVMGWGLFLDFEVVEVCHHGDCATRYRRHPGRPRVSLSFHPATEGLACPWCRAPEGEASVVLGSTAQIRHCICGLHYRLPL